MSRTISLRLLPFGALLLSQVGCISTGRTSIPRVESHYERTLEHELGRSVAFERVERALEKSYEDLPRVLKSKHPETGTFLLEPIVTYRTGGPMGTVNHAPYALEILVGERKVEMKFDLGKDQASGAWAPTSEIPYIRNSFDDVVESVEEAIGAGASMERP